MDDKEYEVRMAEAESRAAKWQAIGTALLVIGIAAAWACVMIFAK